MVFYDISLVLKRSKIIYNTPCSVANILTGIRAEMAGLSTANPAVVSGSQEKRRGVVVAAARQFVSASANTFVFLCNCLSTPGVN